MVENVVIQAIRCQDISPIVRAVKSPIITQTLWAKNENTLVAKFVVLNDRQPLECLAEADAIGNDATSVSLQLVNCTDDGVPLKPVKPLPDGCDLDSRRRVYDSILIEQIFTLTQRMEQNEGINKGSRFLRGNVLKRCREPI
jgi:hypothetical protein